MKKLLTIGAVLLFGTTLYASNITHTIKGGIGLTKINPSESDPDLKVENSIGVTLAWEGIYSFSEKHATSIGFGFKSLNSTFKSSSTGTEIDFDTTWLEIPLLYHYKATEQVSLQAGSFIGYNLSAELSGVDVTDIKETDFGLRIGGTYHITKHHQLNAIYSHGLVNVIDDTSGIDWNSRAINIIYGYTF